MHLSPHDCCTRERDASGFSLAETLVNVVVLTLLMSVVFSLLFQAQKRFQGNVVVTESNQAARAAMELMTQEIGQAGLNPSFSANQNKVGSGPVTAGAAPQCITLNNITQIYPGDWVTVDSGANFEYVKVMARGATTSNPSPACATGLPAPWIQGVFQLNHSSSAFPIISYKASYPNGILQGSGASDDHTLEFFGDVNADGNLNYVVYSLYAQPGASAVSIGGTTYTLYTLYRSVTPVTFATGAVNNQASPLVENVLYNTTSKQGPTGLPIFAYPSTVPISVVPVTVTVVGTVVVNLSVAVNPQSIEVNRVDWFTMATQIRPINLAGAVAFNNAGGFKYLPPLPAGLPMANPVSYYQ